MAFEEGQRAAVQAMINEAPALNAGQFNRLMTQLQQRERKEKARLAEFSSIDPSSWRTFRSRVMEAKSLNQWTDQEAKQHMKIAMTGTAAVTTRDIAVGGDPDADPAVPNAKTLYSLDLMGLMSNLDRLKKKFLNIKDDGVFLRSSTDQATLLK